MNGGERPSDTDGIDGLVLGGGGARAAFQLGALRYLYDHTPFHPQAMTGASVGAVVAAYLAQFAERDDQSRAVDELIRLWCGLRGSADMFSERHWVQRLRLAAPELAGVLTPGAGRLPKHGPSRLAGPRGDSTAAVASVLEFAPEVAGPAAAWTPRHLRDALGRLPSLGRLGRSLPGVLSDVARTRATHRPGPLLSELLSQERFLPERVRTSGIALRIALVALESGELRFLRQDGTLVDRADQPLSGADSQDLTWGLLASSSIPGVFTPVPLHGEHYVDGGCRENVPAEMAIRYLGVPHPYVITNGAAGVARDDGQAGAPIWTLLFRTMEILADECARDELDYARAAGAPVIEPALRLYEPMDVDATLIRLNVQYGWMRAQEAHVSPADVAAATALHAELVNLKHRRWRLRQEADAGSSRGTSARLLRRVHELEHDAPAGWLPPHGLC